jgi:predicted amidophosphoribosyltransferase
MELLDMLFPERCVGCGTLTASNGRRGLCENCDASVIPLDDARCPRCALPGFDDDVCLECSLRPPPFERTSAAFEYGGALADAIRRAKYGRDLATWRTIVEWARPILAPELADALQHGYVVTWVPMNSRAARRRGFDPPAIALEWMGIRPVSLLQRAPLARQAGLAAPTRLDHARSAFSLRDSPPAKVCVFDDVVTTGSTLRAISEMLTSAGAREVIGVAVARTPHATM